MSLQESQTFAPSYTLRCVQSVECATVAVGCIADLKLCVGGGVGTLLDGLLGPLDLQLATVNLPITVGGAAGGVLGAAGK
jgi:hypothetical protein